MGFGFIVASIYHSIHFQMYISFFAKWYSLEYSGISWRFDSSVSPCFVNNLMSDRHEHVMRPHLRKQSERVCVLYETRLVCEWCLTGSRNTLYCNKIHFSPPRDDPDSTYHVPFRSVPLLILHQHIFFHSPYHSLFNPHFLFIFIIKLSVLEQIYFLR